MNHNSLSRAQARGRAGVGEIKRYTAEGGVKFSAPQAQIVLA